jgi:hypothetical protein
VQAQCLVSSQPRLGKVSLDSVRAL